GSRLAGPAGTAARLSVVASYLFSLEVANMPLVQARTVATTVLVFVGLYLILALEVSGRVRGAAVSTLCFVLAVLYLLALAAPPTRHFFDLTAPTPGVLVISLVGTAFAAAALWLTVDRF